MRKTQANPIGTPTDGTVVRVGPDGEHTHLARKNPDTGKWVHICKSGIKHGKIPPLYRSSSKYVTCYRCQKLMRLRRKR